MSFIDVKDRIPTNVLSNEAVRYGVYDEEGKLLRYEYMKREDEPIEEGTAINKFLLDNFQGDLYTHDRYNVPNVVRKIVPVDYVADVIISEEKFEEDCIPKTWTKVTEGTSYTSNGINLTTTSGYRTSEFTLNNACDGDESSAYTTSQGWGFNVVLEFPHAIKITKMKTMIRCAGSVEQYQIQGSNNGTNYITLYTGTEDASQLLEFELTNPDYYKYYKVASSNAASGYQFIYEWQVSEYYEGQFGKYIYVNEISHPLTSYEKGKIVNVEGGSYANEEGSEITSFENPYLNINNLGEKQINGTINYGEKYSLVYNGESWDVLKQPVFGSFAVSARGTTEIDVSGAKFVLFDVSTYASPDYSIGPKIVDRGQQVYAIYQSGSNYVTGALSGDGQKFTVDYQLAVANTINYVAFY